LGHDALDDRGRLAGPQLLAHTAGDKLAEHGVQPTHCLGAQPSEVVVAPRPDAHHDGLILDAQFWQRAGAQRGDGHRAGIVLVGLVDLPGIEQPNPGGEFGLHVEHALSGGDQLLRQQVPQPARPFDRPRPLPPATGPVQQRLGLFGRGAHPQLSQLLLASIDHERGVRSLVRINPDHHTSHSVTSTKDQAGRKTTVGTSDFSTTIGERASLEPHRGRDTTDRHLVTEPDHTGRQTVREPARRTSRTLRPTAAPHDESQSDGSPRGGAS
jgi:hypothetical protein